MSYRYIGNKTKILPQIMDAISAVAPAGAVVADLMCGTGAVSEALRLANYKVIASDLMTYSYHHAVVRLNLDGPPQFNGFGGRTYEDILQELNLLPGAPSLFYREYSIDGTPRVGCAPRGYFTGFNASRIDAMRATLRSWALGGALTRTEESLLHHDLLLAANRVANIAGTYGHFRSRWSPSSLRPIEMRPADFQRSGRTDHLVLQGPAERVAAGLKADVCYLDPPYMKRQYAANYHLLETIARGDDPEPVGVSGLRDWWDQYSDFCSKRLIRNAFRAIVESMNCKHFLISYSEDGLLTRADMTELLAALGRVEVREVPHVRFRSNESPLARKINEFIFHLEVT
jgi:adenine-specific DNA-methyltransferase